MFREITFCIKDIKDGQLPCKNPKILWITDGAQGIPCPDKKGCITIKIPDGVVGCVSGEVICEDCGKCPPKPFTICPCNTSADCDICEKCVDGLCVKLCDGKCVNGDCVDCKDSSDCKDGKICIDGDCKCPPGSNFINDRGECVSCLENSHCDKCQVCVGGKCIGKTCDQTCDPVTGECIECINSGHCSSREDGKHCCENKKCVCCEGFVFNLALNKCVPKPKCNVDTECPECEICVNGKCQPRVCPQDTICIKDKCVPICDCSNPICNRNSACTRYNSTTCICISCEGSCSDNSECGDSCYCKDGNCVPNPCAKPCATGADCGPNCGCLNGKCVPCSSGNCKNNDCTKIDGCKCIGTSCSGDPCSGPCANGADCGEGCGCLNGRCVSCDKLSCDECAITLGCNCINGKCLGVPKCNGSCTSSSDCPLGCTCIGGKCVSCASFSCNDCDQYEDCKCLDGKCQGEPGSKDCNQDITIEKIDCSFLGKQDKTDCCSCPELKIEGKLISITSNGNTVLGKQAKEFKFEFEITKNGLLLPDIELPISGKIRFAIETKYRSGADTFSMSTSQLYDISNQSKFDITQTLLDYGVNGDIIVDSYEIRVDQITNIQLKNNCTYKVQSDSVLVTRLVQNKFVIGYSFSAFLQSLDCRAPLFTWYRGLSPNNISEKVKEIYAADGGDSWFDYISDCTDGFCSGYYYKLISDCGCNTVSNYLRAIFCPKDLLGVYNMDKFKYSLLKCGKEFKITDLFNNCVVNSKENNCAKCPIDSQVKFILKLYTEDGLVKQESFSFSSGSEIIGYTFNATKPITKVSLEHSQDNTCKVEFTHDSGFKLDIISNCEDNSVEINTGIAACDVKLYQGALEILTTVTDAVGKAIITGISSGIDYTVKVNCDSCLAEKSFKLNCCSEINGSISGSYNISNNTLTANIIPGNSLKSYSYYIDGNNVYVGGSSVSFGLTLNNGTHLLSATDNMGCTYGPIEINVDICPNVNILISSNYDSTIGFEKVNITNVTGGQVPYKIELLSPTNVVVRSQTNVVSFPLSFTANDLADGLYKIKVTDNNGCNNIVDINLEKGILCNANPADINASRVWPGNKALCPTISSNLNAEIFVNNSFVPYTVNVIKDPNIPITTETFTNGGNSSSGKIVFAGTIGLQDKYTVSDFPDGIYTFKVTDSRLCTDTVQINVDCVCQVPINFDTDGIICDSLDQDHILKVNFITGGVGNTYRVVIYSGDFCDTAPIVDTVVIGNGPTNITIPFANRVEFGGNYSIKVYSGNCQTTCILAAAPDCSGGGGGGGIGDSNCLAEPTDFNITGGCTPTVTNNFTKSVLFTWTEVTGLNCVGGAAINNFSATIAPGMSHTFPSFSYPGLYHKWGLIYSSDLSSGDPLCSLTGCYLACHTNQTCTPNPINVPTLECIKTNSYRRLKITNDPGNGVVLVYINGVLHSMPLNNTPIYINYQLSDTGVKTVVLKCIYDENVTSSPVSITMNC